MGMSFGHLALLLIIILVVFGAGRLPQVMGDLGKGLRAFKDGFKEGESEADQKLIASEEIPTEVHAIKDAPKKRNTKKTTNI